MGANTVDATQGCTSPMLQKWQESLSGIFGNLTLESAEREFGLDHAHYCSGGGDLVVGAGPPHYLRKSPGYSSAHKSAISVFMVEAGRVHVRHAKQHYELNAGQIAVFDQTQDLILDHVTPYKIMSLLLPRTAAASASAASLAKFNRPIDAGFGSAKALNLLVRDVPNHFSPQMDAHRGLDAMMNVISYAFRELLASDGDITDEDWRFVKARHFVYANFRDSNLNRDLIAARIGVSVRTLYRILSKHEVSVAGLVTQARLSYGQKLLCDAAFAGVSIAEIAQQAGFSDASQFTREFKQRFGQPPGRYRSIARSRLEHESRAGGEEGSS